MKLTGGPALSVNHRVVATKTEIEGQLMKNFSQVIGLPIAGLIGPEPGAAKSRAEPSSNLGTGREMSPAKKAGGL